MSYNQNGTLIGNTTNLVTPIPGQFTQDGLAGIGISNKYFVGSDATIFTNGLFVGRVLNDANQYTIATSLDAISSPSISNILGAVAINNWSETTTGLARIGASIDQWIEKGNYEAGEGFNLANQIPGMIFVWACSSLPVGTRLYVYGGETVTDAALNIVYPGSLVSGEWVAANTIPAANAIDVSSIVHINAQYNLQTFDYGSLVPVSILITAR